MRPEADVQESRGPPALGKLDPSVLKTERGILDRRAPRVTLPRLRRALVFGLGRRRSGRGVLLIGALLFAVAFSVRSLHAVDLAALMHTAQQPGVRMATRYDEATLAILRGEGVLFPRHPDPSDTALLARPPGYSLFLSLVYRALGRSYFAVQFVQNILDSLGVVLAFALAKRLLGFAVGVASGLTLALSPHFAYYANLILPDTLCVLPILSAVWLLTLTRRPERGSYLSYAAAGAALGVSAWLRPNTLPLAPVIGLALVLVSKARGATLARSACLLGCTLLVVSPITLRNYFIYREFVPVSINMGIVLWEGIADAGGERFGAKGRDFEVAWQEAQEHKDPRYAEWWASPDGIARDRARTRKSLTVILEHPLWFAGTMVRRMGEMLTYAGPDPPVVDRKSPDVPESFFLLPGERLSWARPAVAAAQELLKAVLQISVGAGVALVFLLSWRRALVLAMVPVCSLLFQSMMHLEFRVTLPMQCFLFVFAATTWVLVASGLARALDGALAKFELSERGG
jgi:hypothetical protein